ncbi:MAG: VOC family protein [Methyloligellaceae bacterium]
MTSKPTLPPIGPCSPLFVVSDITTSLAHYHGTLGFDVRYQEPENDPFFAIVGRGSAQLMLKEIEGVAPVPNSTLHAWARWDAFVFVDAPDLLVQEFIAHGATFRVALGDTDDGLRGFEIADPDGYVCFYGRPL